MTRADKIRAMSDEELAMFLTEGVENDYNVDHYEDGCEIQKTFVIDVQYDKQSTYPHLTMLSYLQQEVDDATN